MATWVCVNCGDQYKGLEAAKGTACAHSNSLVKLVVQALRRPVKLTAGTRPSRVKGMKKPTKKRGR
jgi:DNA-directed RNA polymerase subunit RPC12/RpoP